MAIKQRKAEISANKNKYFEVTTTKIVSAPNKTEALAAAKRARVSDTTVEQIPATIAREYLTA
jgi:hypothetical protein